MRKILGYVKNNKGFTLIELLAVIVILAILMLVASTNVFNILDNARRGSFRTEFLALLQSAETTASMDMMNGTLSQTQNTKCYVIGQSPLSENFSNNGNYTGSVLVELNADGSLSLTGWMRSNYFTVTEKTSSIGNNDTDIPASNNENNTSAITTCGNYIS